MAATLVYCLAVSLQLDAAALPEQWQGREWQRKTVYHSPQTPGYSAWVGTCLLSDHSVLLSLHQATGSTAGRTNKPYDYSGLDLANVFLRSTDTGRTWTKTAEEHFASFSDRPAWGGSYCGLAGKGIIRAVDGSQLPSNGVPRTIFFQRSTNLGATWGPPEIPPEPKRPVTNYLGDFGDCISRVRRVSDGRRLLATGVKRSDPSPEKRDLGEPVVMFSQDEGKHWEPLDIELKPDQRGKGVWDEWDAAELPGDQFLCVFRRRASATNVKEARWQGILRKQGGTWFFDDYHRAPFPHSGHPELLATREGLILHLASTGVHYTADAGKTWHELPMKGLKENLHTRYYPRSLETKDGQILVFSHTGSDDYYGRTDQSIVMDSFRLARVNASGASAEKTAH